jgi:8-oxo-dGTP pyrophosphatase MutT (NUDIX family)
MPDYIAWLRRRVGHDPVLMNFACGIVRDDAGRVLLQLRGDRERDVWGFPGGAVELGESVADAAIREVAEETGLDIEVTSLHGIYSNYPDRYPNGDVVQAIAVYFHCRVLGGTLSADGHETLALDYFHLDQLPTLVNRQHEDVAADLRAGRTAVWR